MINKVQMFQKDIKQNEHEITYMKYIYSFNLNGKT